MAEQNPTDPQRVKSFVKYFNNYIAALTVAVIPIPLANWGWVPIFDAQRHILSVVTPIFCFLVLGFLFFFRQSLAGPMFPNYARRGELVRVLQLNRKLTYMLSSSWDRGVNFMPLVLIAGSFWCACLYYARFIASLGAIKTAPDKVSLEHIPDGNLLILYFILAFVCAEAAFVWMALKEYIQDVLEISDRDLMIAPPPPTQGAD